MCNQPTRLTPGSLNRVPASAGGKGWNVTSAGWQVTLCDHIWHVSSSSGEACCELLYPVTLLLLVEILLLTAEHVPVMFSDRLAAKLRIFALQTTEWGAARQIQQEA